MTHFLDLRRGGLLAMLCLGLWATVAAAQPAPPSNLSAEDKPWDGGEAVILTWTPSPDDNGTEASTVVAYKIFRSMTDKEVEEANKEEIRKAEDAARKRVTEEELARFDLELADFATLSDDIKLQLKTARAAAAAAARVEIEERLAAGDGSQRYKFVSNAPAGSTSFIVPKLERGRSYTFRVETLGKDTSVSEAVTTTAGVAPTLQLFDGSRFWLLVWTFMLCGAIIMWIGMARAGRPINVRKIAGLEAVDEAVGRATEMGRSCLFVPGIQDMNDIQTIAGITVLARVAKTAAEYDAKVEVPTSRSLVMTTARETVQASFLAAGRPDAFNEDLIYYVTDEQFGYVAYLSGMMVRDKPAACFYMGSFFAESLILAETGNSIGAIQVAGTAQPAQLPFFVAACDYTLIGEEFFAASAYLSGSAEELGSLKGQDIGKLMVAILMLVGIFAATFGFDGVVSFLRDTMLT